MSLVQNLFYAETAVKYVESHLRGQASNKSEDVAHLLQRYTQDKWAQIQQLDSNEQKEESISELNDSSYVQRETRVLYAGLDNRIDDAREARRKAGDRLNSHAIKQHGIGKCFEHAVLACHYLNLRRVPSYYLETDSSTNHVFVVIGAAENLDGTSIRVPSKAPPGEPLGTGDSVVCDPWYHEWFGIQQYWGTKMYRILSTTNALGGQLPEEISLTFNASTHVT